jgi:uncharacterized cupin superfamily protein
MAGVAHWDDVEVEVVDFGHIAGRWQDLGTAAGSSRVGVHRIRLGPGQWSTPAHSEQAEEEIFYVLGGSGLSWQDGSVYEVASGDCLVHLTGAEAHTLRAGPDGLDVLAFGERAAAGTTLPRAGVSWLGASWVDSGGGEHPFAREAATGPPELPAPSPRPPRIVNATAVAPSPFGGGEGRAQSEIVDLGRTAGSSRTGLRIWRVAPGKQACPQHCHSSEEELFVVLEGAGEVELGDERQPVREGSVVARPPATGVAHAFHAGAGGLSYLAYSNRVPGDVSYYPRSRKLNFRAFGVIVGVEPLDYWDGE